MSSWRGKSVSDKVLSVLLIAAILAGIGALTYVIATPGAGAQFTDFYILGLGGKATNYPDEL
jgi:uncharacterized membrane protein